MTLALVTGGTRGIGRAIAARLAADGFEVIAAARQKPEQALPARVRFAACDVADAAAVAALFAPLDRVDVLVNNAGLAGANALEGDDVLWHAIVSSNLHGTYHCCKAALGKLPDGDGRIVNIASILGLRGVADQTAYCAAKHGVVGLTRALALALAPRRITVNAVCPGLVATGMAEQRFRELGIGPGEAAAGVPTGRISSPEEVAEAVAFLVGAGAGSITGHALPVDGGVLAAP
ncbi:MAG: SDR family oxidoreductase [Rhodospirillales bacterium]|nr:SDR family oxidoreductase [Rhodospirillales bacterium]